MAWKVSNVMAMAIDHCESRYGINVVDERGRPVITLIYGEKVEAEEAAKAIPPMVAKRYSLEEKRWLGAAKWLDRHRLAR
jgi:hypothetical protein